MQKKPLLFFLGAVVLAAVMYFLPTKSGLDDSHEGGSGHAVNNISSENENTLLHEADSLRDLFESQTDTSIKFSLAKKAIERYQLVLKRNPSNLDAKAALGLSYAEASPDPMKGIMMLREVVTTNPNHEKAQFFLGILSIQSGQYAKAADRFEKVLQINSENINVHLYLGDVYLKTGNKQKAIDNYQAFISKTKDRNMASEVGKMVEKIKSE